MTVAAVGITVGPCTGGRVVTGRRAEPVTIGVPLPRALVHDPSRARLLDASSQEVPLQTRALDWWPDGSIRWLLIDFQATTAPGVEATHYSLELGRRWWTEPETPVTVSSIANGRAVVRTGVAEFHLRPGSAFPFERVAVDGANALDVARTHLRVEDAAGSTRATHIARVDIEEIGPLRATVRLTGTIGDPEEPLLDLVCRLHFYSGSAAVRFDLLVRNERKAGHPGGIWELSEEGSVFVKSISMTFGIPGGAGGDIIRCSPETGWPETSYRSPFTLYQDSSGGEAWKSPNHVNRLGDIPLTFRGYRITSGQGHGNSEGFRATPIVSVQTASAEVSVGMPHFWEQFPKAMEASSEQVTLGLFPRQFGDLHHIQGGEQKTHTFVAAFGRDRISELPLDWVRAPLLARTDPVWNCSTEAIPYLVPVAEDPNTDYTRLVEAAIEGDDSFAQKRERIDEYGWRNFGDIYADHEAAFAATLAPLVSHYNNQYDAVAGFAYQFLRSGDTRWWTAMDQLASHVVDIDVYHTDRDKAAYNGGLFWHTYHYTDAGASTHRSYPRHDTIGGGPSAEHNYTTGLMLHYFLTGNPASRQTAIDLARWVVRMDDGRRTVFRWLAGGYTGLASATGSPLYHGPGRGGANSINALLDAHRLTGEDDLLAKAEQLIRRSIHPADDLEALQLLDAERRWYYTVFLRTLGTYLDCKLERGELDAMFAYARASLLHYARWMAAHEHPYLDRPDILEYPNESWAAQDMRKSDVFNLASKHASGAERTQFLDRAECFFRYSTATLGSMKTHTRARPTVLLLTLGLMHAHFQRNAEVEPPALARADFGLPQPFVPQKARAADRFRALTATAALLVLVVMAYLIL